MTLFFDGWATETSFDYVLALFGLFLLCVAQSSCITSEHPSA